MRFTSISALLAAFLFLTLTACTHPAPAPVPTVVAVPVTKAQVPAVTPQASPEEIAKEVGEVQTLLKAKYPKLQLQRISRIAIGDAVLYEFAASGVVGYTNRKVDYVMIGEVVVGQGDQVVNITKARAVQASSAVYAAMPKGGLEFTYGAGKREFYIFSDPDCPFCQEFEKQLTANADAVNARVTVLPYVLPNLHPNGIEHAKYIWCTTNPAAAWKDWMQFADGKEGNDLLSAWTTWSAKNASVPNCPAAGVIDQVEASGRQMGFNQTPTLMFKTGMTWPGAPSMDELQLALKQVDADLFQVNPGSAPPAATDPSAVQGPASGSSLAAPGAAQLSPGSPLQVVQPPPAQQAPALPTAQSPTK
jgi:thiol:disulfide interchange protein DsbC